VCVQNLFGCHGETRIKLGVEWPNVGMVTHFKRGTGRIEALAEAE
jgi:hypothetical protein